MVQQTTICMVLAFILGCSFLPEPGHALRSFIPAVKELGCTASAAQLSEAPPSSLLTSPEP